MEHDEIFENIWEEKENDWLPCIKNDVLSTAFCYSGYVLGKEELTIFSMKNSLTLPYLANNYFISLRDANDEPIYTCTDHFMTVFVRNSIKSGRCNAFNQYYKFELSDEVINNISEEFIVNGNICHLLEKYFEFLSKNEKLYAKELDSNYDFCRDINQKEKIHYSNIKPNMLPIQKKCQN